MARSDADTVEQYLHDLPPERRRDIETVRQVVLDHLPEGYEETVNWGMISYEVPLERFPDTYNGQPLGYAALASQKRHMALYLMGIYGPEDATWFRERYRASGKRMDVGKSCVRFRSVDDLPLDLVGDAIARTPVEAFIEQYRASRRQTP